MIGKDEALKRICRNYHLVENYDKAIADEENKWHLHHRRETDEMKSRQQLMDEGRYYDVDPSELIFLSISEHTKLHNENLREETRKKLSENNYFKGKHFYGESNQMYGKPGSMLGKHHSEETKKKMSEAASKKSKEETSTFGTFWWNDGITNVRSKICPGENFVKGRKDKLTWWNNSKVNTRADKCPGEGFVRGRIKLT